MYNNIIAQLPQVKFIIPAYKSIKTIQKCLDSIALQDYPQEMVSVSVVENGVKDGTESIVKSFAGYEYFFNSKRGRSAARNYLMEDVVAPLIAYVDADVVLDPSWLRLCVEKMDSPFVAAVNGPVLRSGSGWLDDIRRDVSVRSTQSSSNTLRGEGFSISLNTAAILLRTEALRAVGGFDESLARAEDLDLTHKLLKKSFALVEAPGAIASVSWEKGAIEYFIVRNFVFGKCASKVHGRLGIKSSPSISHFLPRRLEGSLLKSIAAYVGSVIFHLGYFLEREVEVASTGTSRHRPVLITRQGKVNVYFIPSLGAVFLDDELKVLCYQSKRAFICTGGVSKLLGELLKFRQYDLKKEEERALDVLIQSSILLPANI